MNIGGLLGGFAEGASDGVRTALDFVDRRERRAYQQEDMANKREDRKLAMEDRGRRLQDETKARELVDMQRTELTDKFNEGQRQKRLRDTIRTELKTRFDQQSAARDAWGRGDDGDQPPPLRGTVAIYDDMLDNPPEEWRSDPEYGTAITALRTAAEKEGLGAMYSAWKRNATPLEMGKIFNRHGDHYAAQFKSGKDFSDEDIKAMGQDPADKKNILVAIDDKGRHLPMHMPSVGKFLGLEKESKWVKGPDNSGVVYDENDPRRHYTFPDQPKAPTQEDGFKATEANTKQWNEYVGRAATVLKNGYFAGAEINFDSDRGKKYTRANGLAQTWLANGMSNPDGTPLQPERVAELAKGVADEEYTVEDVNKAFKFSGRPALGAVPPTAGQPQSTVGQPQSTAGQQSAGGLSPKALVVAGDTRPTTPPQGAPTDGNWRRTEQGWIYVSKDGANVWEGDGAPAAPAAAAPAAKNPASKPAAPAAPVVRPTPEAAAASPDLPGLDALTGAAPRAGTPASQPTPPAATALDTAAPRPAVPSKPLKIPRAPGNGQAFEVERTGDIEVYRFAKGKDGNGDIGYFIPDGKGVKFQRIDGNGMPSGTPISADSKEAFIARRINYKGRK